MKIRIEIEEELQEDEILIRCKSLNHNIQKLHETILGVTSESKSLILYKENTEYYIQLENILFFETSDSCVSAHTVDHIYQTKYKLYELEELLPGCFMRVSKSTILNINPIYSITHNLTASSVVQFEGTHKQVYVSRYYYKPLKCRLEEKRKSL